MPAPAFNNNSVEGIFTNSVWNYLKDQVNGKVFCKVIDNVLQVSIKNGNSVWRCNKEEIAEQIINGMIDSRSCANDILTEYKNYIFGKARDYYFKVKNS